VRQVGLGDDLWRETLVNLDRPREGESLLSFTLRLDERNELGGGSVLVASRRAGLSGFLDRQVFPRLGSPRSLASARWLDLPRLAHLAGGVTVRAVESMTLRPLLVWLHAHDGETLHDRHLRTQHALCPKCAERKSIPPESSFRDLAGCAAHGLRFVERCPCGSLVRPFSYQLAFRCDGVGCGRAYAELPARPLDDASLRRCIRYTTRWQDLLTFARTAPPPHRAVLSGALRLLLLDAGATDKTHKSLLQCIAPGRTMTLAKVARVLRLARASPADLESALVAARRQIDMFGHVRHRRSRDFVVTFDQPAAESATRYQGLPDRHAAE
jgi:hypothetical protein